MPYQPQKILPMIAVAIVGSITVSQAAIGAHFQSPGFEPNLGQTHEQVRFLARKPVVRPLGRHVHDAVSRVETSAGIIDI